MSLAHAHTRFLEENCFLYSVPQASSDNNNVITSGKKEKVDLVKTETKLENKVAF